MISLAFKLRRAVAALWPLVVTPVWAQSPLSLDAARALAVQRAPALVAQDAAAAGLRELAVAAGQLPDPVLRLGVDNLPLNGPDAFNVTRDFMTMRRIGLMQELPHAAKRQLKTERVERDGQRLQAERVLALASLRRDTTLAWLDRYYAEAVLAVQRQQLEEASAQQDAARIAYQTGRGSQADVLAADMAQARAQDQLQGGEARVRASGIVLARWVGPQAAQQPLTKDKTWVTSTLAETMSEPEQHPQLTVLAAQVAAMKTELRQAQANTESDWTVEATFQQRGPAYAKMFSVGLSVPLQWDRANRQDREISAKQAAVDEARARLEDARLAHESEWAQMRNDWLAGLQRLKSLQATLVPQAQQRAQAALTAYATGKGDLSAVLAARRDATEARLMLLNLEQETARLWAQVDFLNMNPAHAANGNGAQP